MTPSEIKHLIEIGFDSPVVKVQSDDNTHFSALVIAKEFNEMRLIARHQMIYKCLGSLMGNEIHALSINALTPDEWNSQSNGAPDFG